MRLHYLDRHKLVKNFFPFKTLLGCNLWQFQQDFSLFLLIKQGKHLLLDGPELLDLFDWFVFAEKVGWKFVVAIKLFRLVLVFAIHFDRLL